MKLAEVAAPEAMVTDVMFVVSPVSRKTPPADDVDRSTVSAAPVARFPLPSSRATVIVPEVTPAVEVWGAVVMTNFVAATELNVAVTFCAVFPILKLHELPAQPVTPPLALLQPAKTDPALAVAVSVPTSLFAVATLQVVEHNWLFAGLVVSVTCTWPLPVPEKLTVRLLFAAV